MFDRHRARRRSARERRIAAGILLAAVALVFPPAASASYFVSFKAAKRATHRAVSGTDTLTPSCRPRDGANTRRNRLHFDWHRWICDWRGSATRFDRASGTCRGSLYITGRRGRHAPRVRARKPARCRWIVPSAPTAPGSAPSPPPVPGAPTQQQILDHAFAFAKSVGQSQISSGGGYYRWLVNPAQCRMVQADTARCTTWLHRNNGIIGTNSSGQYVYAIQLYRDFAFSEWLTSAPLTFNDYTQFFDIIDPAQVCSSVDGATLYDCSPAPTGP
jgi:hypothetical protein